MKPAPFHYERPDTLAAALALLAQNDPETKILAGGQSLVPMMNFRLAKPERLIDINRLPGLDYIRLEGSEIAIGALARHADVKASALVAKHVPLMHSAYEWIAHAAVRNRGTLCGNLCHSDPASEMPAIMLVCGATMVLQSKSSKRRVAAADFFETKALAGCCHWNAHLDQHLVWFDCRLIQPEKEFSRRHPSR